MLLQQTLENQLQTVVQQIYDAAATDETNTKPETAVIHTYIHTYIHIHTYLFNTKLTKRNLKHGQKVEN